MEQEVLALPSIDSTSENERSFHGLFIDMGHLTKSPSRFNERLDFLWNPNSKYSPNCNICTCVFVQFKKIDERTLKMQQVVVADHAQGKGIGTKLILFSEQFAVSAGFSSIFLHARESVIGFYERLNYVREGERFIEVTIPHFKARKKLQ